MSATLSSQSIAAAQTASATYGPVTCSGDYAKQVFVHINQASTITVGAIFVIQYQPSGSSNWYSGPAYAAPAATGDFYWPGIDVPITSNKVEVVYTAPTGGGTGTITAELGEMTGI